MLEKDVLVIRTVPAERIVSREHIRKRWYARVRREGSLLEEERFYDYTD